MKETYTRQEVAQLLVILQWYALSQHSRLFTHESTFLYHADKVMDICADKKGKEAIDAVIEYSQKS